MPLQEIETGEAIVVAWYDSRTKSVNEKKYRVSFVRVVNPNELSLLAPTTEDALTLITCYPFGHGRTSPQRFIVRALPANSTG